MVELRKSIAETIFEEASKLANDSYYKDIYGCGMNPEAVRPAAGTISDDLANILKSIFLLTNYKEVGYDDLIDIYNYMESNNISSKINPKIWDEISLNIIKWGKWHKLYSSGGDYCKSVSDDIISIRDVNECEEFCDQLRKYVGVLLKRFKEKYNL